MCSVERPDPFFPEKTPKVPDLMLSFLPATLPKNPQEGFSRLCYEITVADVYGLLVLKMWEILLTFTFPRGGDTCDGHPCPTPQTPGRARVQPRPPLDLTFVQRLGHLAGMSTPIGTAFLEPGAVTVGLAALDARGGKAAGPLGGRAVALLHGQDVPAELAAGQALVVLLGEQRLRETGRDRLP